MLRELAGLGIGFPKLPSKKDVKELRRQVAHDRLEVIESERSDSEAGPGAAGATGGDDRTIEEGRDQPGT